MEVVDERVLKMIKPFVLGWVEEVMQHNLGEGLAAGGLNLGTETSAGHGDLRMSGSIKKSIPVAARVRRAGPLSLPNAAWNCLPFDGGARFSLPAHREWWRADNPSRLSVPLGGVYLVHAQARFAANPNGLRGLQVRRNAAGAPDGGSLIAVSQRPALAGDEPTDLQVTSLVLLAPGDTLEAFARQASGVDLALPVTAEMAPELMMARLA